MRDVVKLFIVKGVWNMQIVYVSCGFEFVGDCIFFGGVEEYFIGLVSCCMGCGGF